VFPVVATPFALKGY